MRFTHADGREVTVEFLGESSAITAENEHLWATEELNITGDTDLVSRMHRLLMDDSVKVNEPSGYVEIDRFSPRHAVLAAAKALAVSPVPDDLDDADRAIHLSLSDEGLTAGMESVDHGSVCF